MFNIQYHIKSSLEKSQFTLQTEDMENVQIASETLSIATQSQII